MQVVRRPHPALAGGVRSYYGFSEQTGGRLRRREGPGASVVVIVSFGLEWRVGSATEPGPLERHTSFVGGLRDSSVLTQHDGRSEGIQVNLAPPAASALLGLPMHELAHRVVALEDVLGPASRVLVERLRDAGSWPARFELLDRALVSGLAAAPPPSRAVQWAWRRLEASRGRLRVGTLCDELGWSRKRLVARFRDEVGLPPKAVARLLRFEHAIDLLEREPVPGWAEIAATCGYYDQSHLSNEFREISGVTPTAFAQQRVAA